MGHFIDNSDLFTTKWKLNFMILKLFDFAASFTEAVCQWTRWKINIKVEPNRLDLFYNTEGSTSLVTTHNSLLILLSYYLL